MRKIINHFFQSIWKISIQHPLCRSECVSAGKPEAAAPTILIRLAFQNNLTTFASITRTVNMARNVIIAKIVAFLLVAQGIAAFVPQQVSRPVATALEASSKPLGERFAQVVATTAAAVATSPLMALAEEVDDYEYGAVNAPIGIAWAGGVLAVLTALLPLALQGGEEAFEEMKERDSGNWGTGNTDALKKRR